MHFVDFARSNDRPLKNEAQWHELHFGSLTILPKDQNILFWDWSQCLQKIPLANTLSDRKSLYIFNYDRFTNYLSKLKNYKKSWNPF